MKNLVKEPTCYKTEIQRCIDLILTNRNQSMQHTTAIETGLSDFHKMIVTVLTTFPKQGPSIINYWSYKNFDQTSFKQDLRIELGNVDTSNINYGAFETAFDFISFFHFKIIYPGIQFSLNNCFTMYPATKNKNNLITIIV